jgi:hypothetical protein
MYFQWSPANGNAQLGMLDKIMDGRIIFLMERARCRAIAEAASL